MAIDTFDDGIPLRSVRILHLNPAIQKINSLDTDVTTIKTNIKTVTDRVAASETTVKSFQTSINSGVESVSNLKTTVDSQGVRISALENNKTDLSSTLANINSTLKTLGDSITSISTIQKHFTPVLVSSDMSTTGSTLTLRLPKINTSIILNKTSTSNVRLSLSSVTGSVTIDVKKWAFYDGSGVDNQAFDSSTYTTTPTVIDGTIYLTTRDGPYMEIWNGPVCWRVNIMISGSSAERVRIYAYPITGPDITI